MMIRVDILDFQITEIGNTYFVARWRTNVPSCCRIQICTSPSMDSATVVSGNDSMSFIYDSRKTAYADLPAMGRFFVRILAEDKAGNRAASKIAEVLIPEGDAMPDVLLVPLGSDCALAEWFSNEPTIGQACFRDAEGKEVWSAFEPVLRRYHTVSTTGLVPGMRYEVYIRQGIEREKWGDQFLRSRPYNITMPKEDAQLIRLLRNPDGTVVLCHQRLRLILDKEGVIRAFLAGDERLTTLIDNSCRQSAFHLTLADGEVLSSFPDNAAIGPVEKVTTEFGPAVRIQLSGTATMDENTTVCRRIQVEMYPEHPDAAIFRVFYEVDKRTLCVKSVDSLALCLDRRLALSSPAKVNPWDLSAYLPVSHKDNFGDTYSAVTLTQTFSRSNLLAGDGDGSQHHGGVPLFDLWCRETGIALGHLNDHQIPVSFPINVGDDCRVRIAMHDQRCTKITKSCPYTSPPLLLVLHKLDFFDAVSRFRKLMAARGIMMADPPEDAYEPFWSTWGYSSTFNKDDVRRALPVLRELGIKWIQLDDPWYADHGDFSVNPKVFAGGADDMIAFSWELREAGFHIRLWCCSGHVTSNAPYAQQYPGRLIRDVGGQPVEIHSAGCPSGAKEHEACPCIPENSRLALNAIEQMFGEYGAEAIYQDGVYACPACYAKDHDHVTPYDTIPAHAELYRELYCRVMELTGGKGVVMLCTCGKVPDFYILPSVNRVATADPMGVHVRKRMKSLKALLGPRAAVDFDFIEVSQNDFASAIGTGAALYIKFTTPLEEERLEQYRKWFAINREHDLARGEYLNLYDLVHDQPETHAIRKNGRIYYGFYASQWAGDFDTPFCGTVELRGLSDGQRYQVIDYVNNKDLGQVIGTVGRVHVDFQGSLLLFVEPIDLDLLVCRQNFICPVT